MAYEFPTENLVPGQIENVPQPDGSVIKYQWTDPPGVWLILGSGDGGSTGPITTNDVLTIKLRPDDTDNPFEIDDPDDIDTQQNVNWYLYDGINELDERLSQDITDVDNQINLQSVLTKGNVADKDIYLTNISNASDIIDISPEKAKVIIASERNKVPTFELQHYAIDDNSQVKLELDNDGTRFDIECDEKVNNIHFRFEEDDKFILNRDGDAVFTGKVQGEPGTQNNEYVTFGQLTTLEEEIEQLAPSLERGSWTFTLNYPPGEGEYTLIKEILDEDEQEELCNTTYAQCLTDNPNDPLAQQECTRVWGDCTDAIVGTKVVTTDQFFETTRIYFNDVDANGVTHSWAEIPPDHFIDIFNEADESFLVGDITSHTGGNFSIDVMSSKGTANGIATVKIFRTQGTVDFDSYVRKSGDEMSGPLDMKSNQIENAGRFKYEIIEVLTDKTKSAPDVGMWDREGKGEVFLGFNGSVWLNTLSGTKLDLDGNEIPWQNVQIGDYIKVHENGHSTRRYSIFGPVKDIDEYENKGHQFWGYTFDNSHAIENGPLVIRHNQRVTITRVNLIGNESNVITNAGGEIHGRIIIRHPGAGPVEIHASDLGDNYGGAGVQIFGVEDKKFVEVSSATGKLKCYEKDGKYQKAQSDVDVVTKGYLINNYGAYQHIPSGLPYVLKYVDDENDAKEKARSRGNWAISGKNIYINRHDLYGNVNISPYYEVPGTTFTVPEDDEEYVQEPGLFASGNTLTIDYQNYTTRGWFSVWQLYKRDKWSLARHYAVGSLTWYQNEPFIKLVTTKTFNLDSLWYSDTILNLHGII